MQTGSLVVSLHCFSLGLLTSTLLSLLLSSHCQSLWWTKCLIFTFGIHIFNFVFVSMCRCDLNYLLLLPIHRTCVCSSKIRILKKVTSLITPKIKYAFQVMSPQPTSRQGRAKNTADYNKSARVQKKRVILESWNSLLPHLNTVTLT